MWIYHILFILFFFKFLFPSWSLSYDIHSDGSFSVTNKTVLQCKEIESFFFVSCVLGLNAYQVADSFNVETV